MQTLVHPVHVEAEIKIYRSLRYHATSTNLGLSRLESARRAMTVSTCIPTRSQSRARQASLAQKRGVRYSNGMLSLQPCLEIFFRHNHHFRSKLLTALGMSLRKFQEYGVNVAMHADDALLTEMVMSESAFAHVVLPVAMQVHVLAIVAHGTDTRHRDRARTMMKIRKIPHFVLSILAYVGHQLVIQR